MLRTHFVIAIATISLAGCPAPAPATDAGSAADTGGSGNDAGGTGHDAGGTTVDSGGGGDVATCQAAVDAVIAACQAEGGDPQRECIYANYRNACTTGRTSVVTQMMNCLMMDACQTLSDPSAAGPCVQGVVSASLTSAHQALGTAICTCDTTQTGCPAYPQYSGAELVVVTEADATTVTTCLNGSGGCAMANTCYMSVPYGAAFLACTTP
jgi:hypothetical protein